MSHKNSRKKTPKKAIKLSKNCKYIKGKLIEYRESYNFVDKELMKSGYQEMARLNLELSQNGFECELAQINEYEKWLCGV